MFILTPQYKEDKVATTVAEKRHGRVRERLNFGDHCETTTQKQSCNNKIIMENNKVQESSAQQERIKSREPLEQVENMKKPAAMKDMSSPHHTTKENKPIELHVIKEVEKQNRKVVDVMTDRQGKTDVARTPVMEGQTHKESSAQMYRKAENRNSGRRSARKSPQMRNNTNTRHTEVHTPNRIHHTPHRREEEKQDINKKSTVLKEPPSSVHSTSKEFTGNVFAIPQTPRNRGLPLGTPKLKAQSPLQITSMDDSCKSLSFHQSLWLKCKVFVIF